MGINWEGALAGLGGSVANIAGQAMQLQISADVQAKRDANLARYQQQSQQAQFAQQDKLATQEMGMNQQKMMAEQQAAMLQREQEVGDATLAHQRGQDDIMLRAKIDPQAAKTDVTVNTGQMLDARTEEFSKAIGKVDADLYDATRKSAQSAVQMEDSLNVLEQIQSEFETGKPQQALATLGQWANTDAGSAMQAWEGTISPIVLAKAEGLSGVLSDKDMEFLKASVPQFGLNNKANSVMIGLMRKGMQRAIDNEKSMQTHLNEHGNLNNWTAPNQQGTMINASDAAKTNMNSANDPLGLFSQ